MPACPSSQLPCASFSLASDNAPATSQAAHSETSQELLSAHRGMGRARGAYVAPRRGTVIFAPLPRAVRREHFERGSKPPGTALRVGPSDGILDH